MNLQDFAKQQEPPARCSVCKLEPAVRAEVDSGIGSGITAALIARWLKSEGHSISSYAIRRHRSEHV